MTKHLLFLTSVLLVQTSFAQTTTKVEKDRLDYSNKIVALKKTFAEFEKTKPFGNKRTPPNEFNKHDFLNTMDPATGSIPTLEVLEIQRKIASNVFAPDVNNTVSFLRQNNAIGPWVERGPYRVGGRVRAIMVDPNDTTGKRVFAAGVTGGLWVNNDITNNASEWIPINDFMANTSIVSLAYDPNNPQIMYAGTGEVQTSDLIGQGVFRSTDGGQTWTNYFFPEPEPFSNIMGGLFFINNIVVRNNNGVSEVYFGVSDAYVEGYFHGTDRTGLYKAVGNGTPSKISLNDIGNAAVEEIKIGADNSIWVSTRRNTRGLDGGKIYKSTDGVNFTNVYNANNPTSRVVLGVSKTNANKVYALLQIGATAEPLRLIKTTDGGQTWLTSSNSSSGINLPVNPLPGMPENDFTRGQSFYDLYITPDPQNDDVLYAGGIDLHKSTDGGNTWELISAWHSYYSNLYYQETGIRVPVVHADQHALVFNPSQPNQLLFGNDGGVFLAPNKNNIIGSASSVQMRNTRFNVTQFYDGKLNPTATPTNEFILAGAQDNGTQKIYGSANANNFYNETEYYGGDGAENEFDDQGQYVIYSYVYNNHYIDNQYGSYDLIQSNESNSTGHFINHLTVDRINDVFYSYSSGLTINKVTNLNSAGAFNRSKLTVGSPLSNETVSELTASPYNTTESSLLLVGTNQGRIFKVINGHTNTPTYQEINTPISTTISSIRFGRTNNDLLVTVSNYNQINVYYSTDGGTTWMNKEGNLPNIPVRTIFMNPENNNEVIVGTDLGVWGTTNFNISYPTWNQYGNGIGNVRVTNFDYRPSTKTLLASTYGRGVFTTQIAVNPLSTDDQSFIEKKFRIYPNPTRNPFSVEFDEVKHKNIEVQIFDTSGKLVKTIKDIKNKESYLLNLPSGAYFVNFLSNKATVYTSQLLVK